MLAMKETKQQTTGLASPSKKGHSAPDGDHQQMANPAQFLQRNLGNGYLQSIAGDRRDSKQPTIGHVVPMIQRTCACGGSCANCRGKEEELRTIQTKLTIGPADDMYEQEADRVAEQVTRMPDSSVQTEGERPNAGINIQRITASGSDTLHSAPDIELNQNGGYPLSSSTRAFMEPRFGVDFGHLRLHTDPDAQQTAAQIQARAFTYGHHIWFGRGESEQNHHLMAHELTHVVQQGATLSTDRASTTDHNKNMAGPWVQRARLPCTSRKTIDIYAVNLPGSTRTIYDDLAATNSVLCQCGIEIKVAGGESWDTNLLDQDPPAGILNAPSGTVRPLTAEELGMLAHKPGGTDVIHVYYVPSFSGPKLAESFWPSQHGEQAVAVSNGALPIVFPHELGHVLLDDGSHHAIRDNLMADGLVNTGAGELEETQCNKMP